MTLTQEQVEQRQVDARVAALSAVAFVKDEDLGNSAKALQIYYDEWLPDASCGMEVANVLVGAFLGVARDVCESSDQLRWLAAQIVPSDG